MIDEHKAGIAATESDRKIGAPPSLGEPYGFPVVRTPRLICIEGNIGAGKTTLSLKLGEVLNAKVFLEPVGENPYLERYYTDPKRYALEMQFWLMSRRFEMHEKAIRHVWATGESVIMDRSIYGDWVFARANWIAGNIDDVGYKAYLHHREVMDRFLLAPHVVLFLDARPEVCLSRVKERARGCETGVTLDYLNTLDGLHGMLKDDMRRRGSRTPVLDWNEYQEISRVTAVLGAR